MLPLLPALLLAPSLAAPRVVLYTMGHDEDLFTRYGHAALCVRPEGAFSGSCYGYGYTDFSDAVKTVWLFARGQGVYWGMVEDEAEILARYIHRDSDVWRQELHLPAEQRDRLIALLEASMQEQSRFYSYHHFYDNCATRIRDPLDEATGGALRQGAEVADGLPYRALAEQGLAGILPLQLALQLGFGREGDHPTSSWQRMFLPAELRLAAERAFGATPERLWTRSGSPIPDTARQGRHAIAALGVLLGALAALMGIRGRTERAAGLVGAWLGGIALVPWGVALVATLTELRWNETLLVLWPTDLLLARMGPETRRRYLDTRLAALALVGLLSLGGLLIQPLWPNLLLAALPLAALRWAR